MMGEPEESPPKLELTNAERLNSWRATIARVAKDHCAQDSLMGQIMGGYKSQVIYTYDPEDVFTDIRQSADGDEKKLAKIDREIEKARFLREHGYIPNPNNLRVEEFPNIESPELQLLWGAVMAHLASHPEQMGEWDESERSPKRLSYQIEFKEHETKLEEKEVYDLQETGAWKQFVNTPALTEYFDYYSMLASKADVKPGTGLSWGRPGSWFWYAPSHHFINIDLAGSLIAGLDSTASVVLHEIGHSQHSLHYTPAMNALLEEMQELQDKARKVGKMEGSDQVRMMRLRTEYELRNSWHYHIEENPVNFFATTHGEGYGTHMNHFQDIIGKSNISARQPGVKVTVDKVIKPLWRFKKDNEEEKDDDLVKKVDAAKKALGTRENLSVASFFYYNGFMDDHTYRYAERYKIDKEGNPDTVQTVDKFQSAELEPDQALLLRDVIGAESIEGLDEKLELLAKLGGVLPRGQMRLLPLPHLPSGLLDSPQGKSSAQIAEIYSQARNQMIDELWDRYAAPHAKVILDALPAHAEDIFFDPMDLPAAGGCSRGDEADERAEEEARQSRKTVEESRGTGQPEGQSEGGRREGGGDNVDPSGITGSSADSAAPKMTDRGDGKGSGELSADYSAAKQEIQELYRKLQLGLPIVPDQSAADDLTSYDLPRDPYEIDEDTMIDRWMQIKSGMPIERRSYEWQEETDDPPPIKTAIDVVILVDSSGSMSGQKFETALKAGAMLFEPAMDVEGVNVYCGLLGQPWPYEIVEPGQTKSQADINFRKVSSEGGIGGSGDQIAKPLGVYMGKVSENLKSRRAQSDHTHVIVITDAGHTDGQAGADKVQQVVSDPNANVTVDYLLIDTPEIHATHPLYKVINENPGKMFVKACKDFSNIPNDIIELLTKRVQHTQQNQKDGVLSTSRIGALEGMGEVNKKGTQR